MKIKISEHFYSIQGEGKTAGYPAIFIRLADCNLLCGGARTQIDRKLHNSASWRCDTIEVWMKGSEYELSDFIKELVGLYDFNHKKIIITGGEPLINTLVIKNLIIGLEQELGRSLGPYIEIETNCTIAPSIDPFFINDLIQYNCSPKLANSGMDKNIRYHPLVVQEFNKLQNSIFKFVVSNQLDCEEIIRDYLSFIDHEKIYLMPAADNCTDYLNLSVIVAEFCKKYNFKFSPRLHLMIWDKKTGV